MKGNSHHRPGYLLQQGHLPPNVLGYFCYAQTRPPPTTAGCRVSWLSRSLLHLHAPAQVSADPILQKVLAMPGLGVRPLGPGRARGRAHNFLLPARLSVAPRNWDPRGTPDSSHLYSEAFRLGIGKALGYLPPLGSQSRPQALPQYQSGAEGGLSAPSSNSSSESPSLGRGMAEGAAPWLCSSCQPGPEAEGFSGDLSREGTPSPSRPRVSRDRRVCAGG